MPVTAPSDAYPTLSAADLSVLESFGVRRTIDVGDVLYQPGDFAPSFFAVVSGAVTVTNVQDGHVITVHGSGQFTGELSILAGQRVYVAARVSAPG